jgi:hypothetical protein
VADVSSFDPGRPGPERAAWLDHIERGLRELASAVRFLRDSRARGVPSGLIPDLPPDVLKAVLQNLASDLQDLQAAVREFERYLSSRDSDGIPPE